MGAEPALLWWLGGGIVLRRCQNAHQTCLLSAAAGLALLTAAAKINLAAEKLNMH